MYPQECQRLAAVHPPRFVMMKMIINHTDELVPIIRSRFELSEEYQEAIRYINDFANFI